MTGGAAPGYGAASNALEQEAANPNYWQWNVAVEKEILREHQGRGGLRGQQGPRPLRADQPERGALRRTVWPTRRPATWLCARSTAPPASATATWPSGSTTATRSTTRCRSAFVSRFGHGSVLSASYTWAKLHREHRRGQRRRPGLSNNNAYTDSTQPNLDRARGGNDRHPLVQREPRPRPADASRTSRRFVKNVFGDWEFTSIVQAATGYPLTVAMGGVSGLPGNGIATGTGSGRQLVAAERGGGQPPAPWTAPTRRSGSTRRLDAQRLPDRHQRQRGPQHLQRPRPLPGGCVRSTRTSGSSGRVKLQLRFEVFNLFNRTTSWAPA